MSSVDHIPAVSIGLPVYNGARFISKAIDSVLAQEFEDFELIIVDNASTDETVEICAGYADRDQRIRLVQNEVNVGAAPNFNKAFHLARARYFKWLAHDDWIEPAYLGQCFEVLESRPDVALCHSRTRIFSEDGQFEQDYSDDLDGENEHPRKRFMSVLNDMGRVFPVFGLMRTENLHRSVLMGVNPRADHVFVAEMALMGKFCLLPEYLNANRTTVSARSVRDQRSWWDAAKDSNYKPTFTLMFLSHLTAIRRSRLSRLNKMILTAQTCRFFFSFRRYVVWREMRYIVASRIPLR